MAPKKRIPMLLFIFCLLGGYFLWTHHAHQQGWRIPWQGAFPAPNHQPPQPIEPLSPPWTLYTFIQSYQLGKANPFQPPSLPPGKAPLLSDHPADEHSEVERGPVLKALLEGDPPLALITENGQEYLASPGEQMGQYQLTAILGETVTLTSPWGATILTLTQELPSE